MCKLYIDKCCYSYGLRCGSIIIALTNLMAPTFIFGYQLVHGFDGWFATCVYLVAGVISICTILFLIFGVGFVLDWKWVKIAYAYLLRGKIYVDFIACVALLIISRSAEAVIVWSAIVITGLVTIYNVYSYYVVFNYSICEEYDNTVKK